MMVMDLCVLMIEVGGMVMMNPLGPWSTATTTTMMMRVELILGPVLPRGPVYMFRGVSRLH